MKLPEMAWITHKLYIVVVECLMYCFIIQNLYLVCLLSLHSNSNAFVHIGDFLELHEFHISTIYIYITSIGSGTGNRFKSIDLAPGMEKKKTNDTQL